MDSGITVAALVAVNSHGSVINPVNGRPWEIGMEIDGEFGIEGRRAVKVSMGTDNNAVGNTTIGVVATDARITKAQAHKVAQMAHDGLARAIRPAHTMFDGDTIFCLATGIKELPETDGFLVAPRAQAINDIGHAAAGCLSRAIINAILTAKSIAGITAFCDLEEF